MKYNINNFKDDNKGKIARSGALVELVKLAKSKDIRVQRNATGALLNMTHTGIYYSIIINIFMFYRYNIYNKMLIFKNLF